MRNSRFGRTQIAAISKQAEAGWRGTWLSLIGMLGFTVRNLSKEFQW